MHLRIVALLVLVSFAVRAIDFPVTKLSPSDPGEGLTLPDAVMLANASTEDSVRISFNIPGTGPFKIEVTDTLVIARSMLIDGTSQPGYAGTPLIQISRGLSSELPAVAGPIIPKPFTNSVFEVNATLTGAPVAPRAVEGFNVTFSALSLTDAPDYAVNFVSGSGHVVEGCFIGIAPDGTPAGNDTGILINSQVDGIRIGTDGNGDDDAAEGNVFGDNFNGIEIGSSSSNVRIAGNRIGLLRSGTAAAQRGFGIEGYFASNIQILNNIVSNNGSSGIFLNDCTDVVIQGNRVVGNGFELKVRDDSRAGILIYDGSSMLVGTNGDGINDAAERNIISGNGLRGVYALGQSQRLQQIAAAEVFDPTQLRIAGNYIGIDADGTALPNGTFEFTAKAAARDLVEDAPGAGIEISGNIYVIVGSDKDGSAGEAAEGNVISGNKGSGIVVQPNQAILVSPQVQGGDLAQAILLNPYHVRIAGNNIGRAPDKIASRPNTLDGVKAFDAVVEVGGTETGAGNLIANNGRNGVTVQGGETALVTILGNSITENTALGIDLGNDGVTPNDPNQVIPGEGDQPDRVVGDPDLGPNYLSNFPVLTSISADRKTVTGTLNAEIIFESSVPAAEGDPIVPSSTYRIEFFGNPESSPNQGQRFLGFTDVTISDQTTFTASFTATLTTPAAPGSTVTSTATRLDNLFPETSEFSIPDANSRVPALAFSSDPTFTPSNPTTDDIVTFMAQASIPGITVTFDFGDGSSATGETVTHQYAAPGVYTVTVTLLDAPTGVSITKVLQVPVVAGAKPAPKPTVFDFRVRTLNVTLSQTPGTDVIKLNGLISLPKGFKLAGNVLTLDVGGVKQAFTLDAKGKSKVGSNVVRFKMPRGKRNQDGSFTASFTKGTFADTLKANGLNKDADGLPGTLAVRANFIGKDFLRLVPTKFKTSGAKTSAKFGVF